MTKEQSDKRGEGDLLPCPFCGNDPTVADAEGGDCYVQCLNSDCAVQPTSALYSGTVSAAAAWNSRSARSHALENEAEECFHTSVDDREVVRRASAPSTTPQKPDDERIQKHMHFLSRQAELLDEQGHDVSAQVMRDEIVLFTSVYEGLQRERKESQRLRRELESAASATREKLPQEDDPYWAYQYSDGSFWTDDIFSTKEQGERFAKGPDADLVEGATLVEIVLRRTDGSAKT